LQKIIIFLIISQKKLKQMNSEIQNDLPKKENISNKHKPSLSSLPLSSKSKNPKKKKQSFFLMTLEDISGKSKQIKIYQNSNPSELAYNFCKENNLDFSSMKYIKSNIKSIVKKFNESKQKAILYNNSNNSIKEEENEDDYLTEGTLKSNEKQKNQSNDDDNFKNQVNTDKEEDSSINNIAPENNNVDNNSNKIDANENYLSEEEILELSYKYLPKSQPKKNKQIVSSNSPYYVEYQGIKIGFGKNKEQNNNLTFKKANKEDTFIHVANYSASHVVIFSNNVNKETLLVGLEIALLLSGKSDAELQVAKIKDIKKGQFIGQVLLNKYESYNLKEVRDSTKKLLLNQKRF